MNESDIERIILTMARDGELLAVALLRRQVDWRFILWGSDTILSKTDFTPAEVDSGQEAAYVWFHEHIATMIYDGVMWRAVRLAALNVLVGFDNPPVPKRERRKRMSAEVAQSALAVKYDIKGDVPIFRDPETGEPYE